MKCLACKPYGCKKCSSSDNGVCEELLDEIDGAYIDGAGAVQPVCENSHAFAYNEKEEICQQCAEGCYTCIFDYDICRECKEGWDFHGGSKTCLRATLGLTAVNFIVVVTILAAGIFTCVKSTKLG